MKIWQVDHDTVKEILESSAEKGEPACFCGMSISGFDFSGAKMTRADLEKATFKRCLFNKANLSNTDIICSYFVYCSFVDADLSHSLMIGSDFKFCDYPDKFDSCRWNECPNGIHFFITREEAVNFSKF